MLNLTRKPGESIILFLPDGREIKLIIDDRHGHTAIVPLVIDAPPDIKILRSELRGGAARVGADRAPVSAARVNRNGVRR